MKPYHEEQDYLPAAIMLALAVLCLVHGEFVWFSVFVAIAGVFILHAATRNW